MRLLGALVLMTVAGSLSLSGCSGDDNEGDENDPTHPQGGVETCYGDCPYGVCDDGMFFSDVPCGNVYPDGVSASSTYCTPSLDGGYCLITDDGDYWAITCQSGGAIIEHCVDGCGSGDGGASC